MATLNLTFDEKLTVPMAMRVTETLAKQITKAAGEHDVSEAGFIRAVLEAYFEQDKDNRKVSR